MIKIFDSEIENGWGYKKVNFVDSNNAFVGYDMSQQCCEWASWFISETEDNNVSSDENSKCGETDYDLSEYVFDTDYFVEVECAEEGYYGSCLDAGSMVRFRMFNKDGHSLYLHVFNAHNGYYAHGFQAGYDERAVIDGYL